MNMKANLHDNRIDIVDVPFAKELQSKPERQCRTGVHREEKNRKITANNRRLRSAALLRFFHPGRIFP